MNIEKNVSLADKNWFRTGGPARYFCRPSSAEDFVQALDFAEKEKMDVCVLGQGANVLISDDGFEGLVLCPAVTTITFDEATSTVTAGAGVSIQDLIDWCLDHELLGLEEFSGIPGSIGGAVFINIHYFQFLLSAFLVKATIVQRATGNIIEVDQEWFAFGYDYSKLFDRQHYVVDATFAVKKGDALATAYAKGRRDEIIRHRKQRYPNERTCGSFFRNFHEHELANVKNAKKLPYIAYYLDKIGIKGELAVGNAQVSHQHANMIVTKTGATSSDVIALARLMQEKVQKHFGLMPHVECQMIGFKQNPLL